MNGKECFRLVVLVWCFNYTRSQHDHDHEQEVQQQSPPLDGDDEYSGPILGGGIGTVSDNSSPPRRRYPERSYDSYSGGGGSDPGSAFRDEPEPRQRSSYNPGYPTRNDSSAYLIRTTPPSRLKVTPAPGTTARPDHERDGPSTRDPFQDPNRYRIAQQNDQRDGVRFVNGRPYR